MRRLVPLLGAVAIALGICVLPAGTAAAFGAEQLECRVTTDLSTNPAFTSPTCAALSTGFTYGVGFEVFNSAGDTFTWTVPAPYNSEISSGCGSASATCVISLVRLQVDRNVHVSVVVQQGGSSETLSESADVPATCPGHPRPVFC
jgi:hypothetical protein